MKRIELDNGLVVITKPVTTNRIVSIVVALKMGSLYETDDEAGLCTLMQDTIIKGTTNRTSEQISLELESMGTRLGSSSNREYGTLSLHSTTDSFEKSLEILYDIIQNPTFPGDAVDLQKNLQVRNILMRKDQALYHAVDLMVEAHYGEHPFHKPRYGYRETVMKFTVDDLKRKYRGMYVPNNMVVSVVGNFDESELMKNLESTLGTLPRGVAPQRVPGEFVIRTEPYEKTETREAAANWFALGWLSPELDHDDYYAMEVLDSITGGSMNSRLFVAIRDERGLAYQVSSFTNARMESGIFVAYVGTKPESYEQAKSVLIDEVRKMGQEKATDEELQNAKNYLRGMNIMGMESNSGQASQYAHHEIVGVGYNFIDKYDKNINLISTEDVMAVGRKYLDGNYALGGVLAK
ncbi:M16 family metallopeptidase [Candidatus Latescibacterota bacterium]